MNISRLYTVLSHSVGVRQTMHVGRVLTPMVALVCRRDKEIAEFTPSPFWILMARVAVQSGEFWCKWVPPEHCSDEQGRCTNSAYAESVKQQTTGAEAKVSRAETKPGYESAPLPFDLGSLQQYASKRWGYTAQETLDTAQSLYENHKIATYPRADCRYLPESQHNDAPEILQALMQSDPSISGLVAGADTHKVSRAFNDKKMDSAHHAIIPTTELADMAALNEREANLFDAIRRFYIAQFYQEHEFSRTTIEVLCGEHLFAASGKTPLKQGWKLLFASDNESAPQDASDGDDGVSDQRLNSSLPRVSEGEPALVSELDNIRKMTRPAPHYTEASLISAMENIGRFVEEEQYKQILKETAGLGTPATRASTIKGARDKGYLVTKNKTLRATDKAFALIANLPPAITSPGMTAAWEQELDRIASGDARMQVFMEGISGWVHNLVTTIKSNAESLLVDGGALEQSFKTAVPEEKTAQCFLCGGEMRRIKGKYGFFWGCQTTACKKTFPDNRGKPVERTPEVDAPDCSECGKPMRLRKGKAPGKKRASQFWGCTGYPECKATLPYKRKAAE